MMDDDWDLHAVVRGCAAAITTNTAVTHNPLPCSPTFPSQNDKTLFNFPGLTDDRNDDDPSLGLHEINQEFFLDPPPPLPSTTTTELTSTPVARVSHSFQEVLQIQTSMDTQTQENIQFKNPMQVLSPPPVSFPAMNPQPNRPRRRKNQQLKMVRQMTQEELYADSWAWRKYGQKPIKGSPYPRNYYRCSTSKGCAARKQVERSVNDPGVFVVSYRGEHTHPRPIHRSSLVGTTRNKSAATKDNNSSNTTNTLSLQKGSSTPASNVSCSSFSPSTQLMESEPVERNDDVEEKDNNIMMLNELMNGEDIYKRFPDSDESSGGGDLLLSPPWTPTSSAATTTTTYNGVDGS